MAHSIASSSSWISSGVAPGSNTNPAASSCAMASLISGIGGISGDQDSAPAALPLLRLCRIQPGGQAVEEGTVALLLDCTRAADRLVDRNAVHHQLRGERRTGAPSAARSVDQGAPLPVRGHE